MNSIGVNGAVRTSQMRGDPAAGGPVADLIVVLQVAEEAMGGDVQHVHRPAVAAAYGSLVASAPG